MRFILAPLLPLALSLGRIRADAVPRTTQLDFSDPPTEIKNGIFGNADLIAYVTALDTTRGAPLVTPEVELQLLSDAAEEIKHLDRYDDKQRARLSAILEATRVVIGQRSGLPATIPPTTAIATLKNLAARFEITFLEYASLSNSYIWTEYCMAALIGKDTLIRLLPFLCEEFVHNKKGLMFNAATIMGDFDTFRAVFHRSQCLADALRWWIGDDVLFSGKVEFVRQIVDFTPGVISHSLQWLNKAIMLNHRSLFEYLYNEAIKRPMAGWEFDQMIAWAFEAIACRGWEDLFKQLYSKHSHCLNIQACLMEAAAHGQINFLKYLLFQHPTLAEEARTHINIAFGAAVAYGRVDTIDFLLGDDEEGNPISPYLYVPQPSPDLLQFIGTHGRWDCIEYLMRLKNEGDVRFENFELAGNARDAVIHACAHGNLKVLKQLLQKDSRGQFVFDFDPTYALQTSLFHACQRGHLPIIQELLKYPDVNPALYGNEALIEACECGHHLVVRELLRDDRVDPGAKDGEALIVACKFGHLMVVRELLQQRDAQYIYDVNPCVRDGAPLVTACAAGHPLVVRELLQHEYVDPCARNNDPLITACKHGHWLVVQELLQRDQHGNYIHHVDPATSTNQCLIAACENGHLTLVKFLLHRRPNADGVMVYVHAGIDAAVQDNMPLLKAIENHHIGVIRFLLRKTKKREYLLPGIAITEQMRQSVACTWNDKLKNLLA